MLYTSGALSKAEFDAFRAADKWGPKELDVTKITYDQVTIVIKICYC